MSAVLTDSEAAYERRMSACPAQPKVTPWQAAADHFEHTVLSGVDAPMVRAYPSTRLYPISEDLGECSKAAQAILFQAAHKAMLGDNTEAGYLLRRFVEQCGKDYADDHEEAFA